MPKIAIALLILLFSVGLPGHSKGRAPSRAKKPVAVRSYKTKRGTAVQSLRRALPNPNHSVRRKTARQKFQRSRPCPSTGKKTGACSGYIVDHIVPLKRGGADSPSNMQWQNQTAAKAKDRTE